MKLDKAKLVIEGMKEAGIDFAVGVPDAQFTQVYQMLSAETAIPYIGASNEGEAAGIAMGAWFGGKKPALIIATSGLLVATYWLARMQFLHETPVLLIIPYRGDIGDPMWMGMYRRTTEPTLQTLDIPSRIVSKSSEIKRVIKECNECARAWLKTVAVLVTEEALW
jgi:sulfopyruvate decarboxylase TPP-binding subunit